jgi:hypothetical protein
MWACNKNDNTATAFFGIPELYDYGYPQEKIKMELTPNEGYYEFYFVSSLDWNIEVDYNNWLTITSETHGKANLILDGSRPPTYAPDAYHILNFYALPNNSSIDRSVTITATLSNNETRRFTIIQHSALIINVVTEGTFVNELNKHGAIQYLKVKGQLNSIDERYLKNRMNSLKYLDLSEAKITNHKDYYLYGFQCFILSNSWSEFYVTSLPNNGTVIIRQESNLTMLTIPISTNSYDLDSRKIICHLKIPPKLELELSGEGSLQNSSTNIKVYVPKNCKKVYELSDGWATIAEIGEIIEMDF